MTVNRWFTSDTHFWHEAVIRFCPNTRDGGNALEMTELLIENWNKVVSPNDIVYHCGDFSFGGKEKLRSLVGRLNGQIHITWGNHDYMLKKTPEFHQMFTTMQDIKHIKVGDYRFIMCHYPMAEWWDCHKGTIMVYGHLHGNTTNIAHQQQFKMMDVGVDTRKDNLMIPNHIDEVLEFVKNRDIMTHHDQ